MTTITVETLEKYMADEYTIHNLYKVIADEFGESSELGDLVLYHVWKMKYVDMFADYHYFRITNGKSKSFIVFKVPKTCVLGYNFRKVFTSHIKEGKVWFNNHCTDYIFFRRLTRHYYLVSEGRDDSDRNPPEFLSMETLSVMVKKVYPDLNVSSYTLTRKGLTQDGLVEYSQDKAGFPPSSLLMPDSDSDSDAGDFGLSLFGDSDSE